MGGWITWSGRPMTGGFGFYSEIGSNCIGVLAPLQEDLIILSDNVRCNNV